METDAPACIRRHLAFALPSVVLRINWEHSVASARSRAGCANGDRGLDRCQTGVSGGNVVKAGMRGDTQAVQSFFQLGIGRMCAP
jgi:hypothetical protein